MHIPVLTYHSVNITANNYLENDHIALAEDLRTIDGLGYKIIPLDVLVDWHRGIRRNLDLSNCVALTFDDGSCFDYYDLPHPGCGLQRSFFNLLSDFIAAAPEQRQPHLHATCFVIASPAGRQELDLNSLAGENWWHDEWWKTAQVSKLFSIECHSWDHVHPDIAKVAQAENIKGNFAAVATFGDCEVQVRKAGKYIANVLSGRAPRYFAYPWGEYSEYLADVYFPRFVNSHGFRAAFTTDPAPVKKSDNVWKLPRYVFGRDWKSPEELRKLLLDRV